LNDQAQYLTHHHHVDIGRPGLPGGKSRSLTSQEKVIKEGHPTLQAFGFHWGRAKNSSGMELACG
jgi:hypothetical protein